MFELSFCNGSERAGQGKTLIIMIIVLCRLHAVRWNEINPMKQNLNFWQ